MKKMGIILLLALLSLALLAGCGKSEEEKTSYEQMKEDSKKEVDEMKKAREDKENNKEELAEKWSPKIDKAYIDFVNETDPSKITALAKDYNKMYDKMDTELSEKGIKTIYLHTTANITGTVGDYDGCNPKIPEYAYKARSLYFKNSNELSNYEYMSWYYNIEDNSVLFLEEITNHETGNPEGFFILKEDNSSLTVNISDFEKNDYSYAKLFSVSEKSIVFETSYNADTFTYEVDISGDTPQLVFSGQTSAGMKYEENFLTAGNEPATTDGMNNLFQSMCLP